MEEGCSTILVESTGKGKNEGNLVGADPQGDLALIQTSIENKRFSYLRMRDGYKKAQQPKEDERIHTLGFPKGEVSPRGGLIDETSDPLLGDEGFTVGMSTDFGASGSPVFDSNGLLIGIVWGGKKWKDDEGKHINVYAADNQTILDFILSKDVKYGASSVADFPLSDGGDEGFFEETSKILSMARPMVVKIYCKEK